MRYLALLSSMPFESNMVRAAMKKARTSKIAGKTVYQGRISGVNIILFNSGIGKINGAHSASCLIEKYNTVDAIINIGVAGAYPGSGLGNGDIAVASKEILGDDGVMSSHGWDSLESIGIPLVQRGRKKYFNEFSLDNKYQRNLIKSLKPSRFAFGPFVTLSATSGNPARAQELEKRFKAICENMEGAAIAHVCAIYKIPFLEVRGISNTAGIRDRRKWDLKTAAHNCQRAILDSIGADFFS